MFKRFFPNKEKKPEVVPEAPFKVGEITYLIEGKADFEVVEIKPSRNSKNYWLAEGKAIVHLPENATDIRIDFVTDADGIITNYAIYFTIGGKKDLFILGRGWTNTDGTTQRENCHMAINEVVIA